MVQRRAARFVKSRYRRTDSETAMLDKLGWPILSKRRKDARLIFFYKIINNSAQVPHEHILTKAYEGTRKKNNHKFRHIAVNTSQYRQSFFPKTVGQWNQPSFADSPTLENFQINLLWTNRPQRYALLGALLSINQNQNQNYTSNDQCRYVRSFFASYLYEKVTMSFYRPYHLIDFTLQILKKGPLEQKLQYFKSQYPWRSLT